MKNYLIIIHYKQPLEVVEQHTPDHRGYLKSYYDDGTLLFSGPFVPRTAGILWAQAAERDVIDTMIAQDPFNRDGVADYEIIEFKPVAHSPLLNKLFEAQQAADVHA